MAERANYSNKTWFNKPEMFYIFWNFKKFHQEHFVKLGFVSTEIGTLVKKFGSLLLANSGNILISYNAEICSIFSLCGRLSPFSKLSGALFYLKNVQCKRCNPCSLASFLQIKSFEDSQSILKILQCAKSSQAFASLSFSL